MEEDYGSIEGHANGRGGNELDEREQEVREEGTKEKRRRVDWARTVGGEGCAGVWLRNEEEKKGQETMSSTERLHQKPRDDVFCFPEKTSSARRPGHPTRPFHVSCFQVSEHWYLIPHRLLSLGVSLHWSCSGLPWRQ